MRLAEANQQHNLPQLRGLKLGTQRGDDVGVGRPVLLCLLGPLDQLGRRAKVSGERGIRLLLHLRHAASGLFRLGGQPGQPGCGDDANHAAAAELATAPVLAGRRTVRRG